ncbi:hypothetical protein BDB00DRAFT_832725 [Zychaea mexicana]|uniref:uncharacterized protein n=1 Tax=Zychaea mexicana TaxID=64656 RepID=UPI0022FF268A|nr:uncharacterized protein BDB00DRAFT_832725 [Zychaea mexicana]KAI9491547.1 hypothetical protein BDB00DRAFT_832725 [Zychaea mexicana]
MRQRGIDVGSGFRGKGVSLQLSPSMNIARVAKAGRNWVGFGEVSLKHVKASWYGKRKRQ